MKKKKGGSQTVLWWVMWITLTIASFFAASAFWTPWIAKHVGSVRETRASVMWVTAVFGTWMLILIPLIIAMYQKVDKAYEDARIRREKAALRFKSVSIDLSRRLIDPRITSKLAGLPETIEGGHLVTLLLKDGRKIPNVFITNRNEILGIYDVSEMTFSGADVTDLEINSLETPPTFLAANWLRLDGVTSLE